MHEGKHNENELFKMFELKKDINTPDRYLRAGTKATREEWEKLFPKAFQFNDMNEEWFIDLSVKKEEVHKTDLAREVVNEIFEKRGLYSQTYTQAAIESCQEYFRKAKSLNYR